MLYRPSLFLILFLLTLSAVEAGWGSGQGGYQQQSPDQGLTSQEAQQLTYLREEEKLARDVYLSLYSRWQLTAFENISGSEQRHMDAVLNVLDHYGLVDPALEQVGLFNDATLQDLYDTLLARGEASPQAALQTGALIEEVDLRDLDEMIAATDKADLIDLYEALHCGSRNHLRAFVRQIENRGLVYTAQVLSQDAVDRIVDSPMERRCGRGG